MEDATHRASGFRHQGSNPCYHGLLREVFTAAQEDRAQRAGRFGVVGAIVRREAFLGERAEEREQGADADAPGDQQEGRAEIRLGGEE